MDQPIDEILTNIGQVIDAFPHLAIDDQKTALEATIGSIAGLPLEDREEVFLKLDKAGIISVAEAKERVSEREDLFADSITPLSASPIRDRGQDKSHQRFFDKREFLPNLLAAEVEWALPCITTPIDQAGKGVELLSYQKGVFAPGAKVARSMAHLLLESASKPDRIDSCIALLKENTKKGYFSSKS